jgi:hypothetical protein
MAFTKHTCHVPFLDQVPRGQKVLVKASCAMKNAKMSCFVHRSHFHDDLGSRINWVPPSDTTFLVVTTVISSHGPITWSSNHHLCKHKTCALWILCTGYIPISNHFGSTQRRYNVKRDGHDPHSIERVENSERCLSVQRPAISSYPRHPSSAHTRTAVRSYLSSRISIRFVTTPRPTHFS